VDGKEETWLTSALLQTVIPGFEFSDHDFLKIDRLEALVAKEQVSAFFWTVVEDVQSTDSHIRRLMS